MRQCRESITYASHIASGVTDTASNLVALHDSYDCANDAAARLTMPKITYSEHTGEAHLVDVPLGSTVMEGGRNAGITGIVAECGGACACSTCHVYVHPDWVERLPPKESMEEDMLEFAPGVDAKRSRLSCQIQVTEALDGLIVDVPAEQA